MSCSCIQDEGNYTIPIATLRGYIEEERARCPVHGETQEAGVSVSDASGDDGEPALTPPASPPDQEVLTP